MSNCGSTKYVYMYSSFLLIYILLWIHFSFRSMILSCFRLDPTPIPRKPMNIIHCHIVHRKPSIIPMPRVPPINSMNTPCNRLGNTCRDIPCVIRDTTLPLISKPRRSRVPPNRSPKRKQRNSRKRYSTAGSIKCTWMICLSGVWWVNCSLPRPAARLR